VTSCHVLVQGLNGSGSGKFSVLLVHVVGTRARVVSDPDAEILHLKRPLLKDLVKRHNLTSTLLHLPQLFQKVPETGLSDNFVGSKETHAVQFWGWFRIGWEAAANNLVFMEAT